MFGFNGMCYEVYYQLVFGVSSTINYVNYYKYLYFTDAFKPFHNKNSYNYTMIHYKRKEEVVCVDQDRQSLMVFSNHLASYKFYYQSYHRSEQIKLMMENSVIINRLT